jgi:hypothetical protein
MADRYGPALRKEGAAVRARRGNELHEMRRSS